MAARYVQQRPFDAQVHEDARACREAQGSHKRHDWRRIGHRGELVKVPNQKAVGEIDRVGGIAHDRPGFEVQAEQSFEGDRPCEHQRKPDAKSRREALGEQREGSDEGYTGRNNKRGRVDALKAIGEQLCTHAEQETEIEGTYPYAQGRLGGQRDRQRGRGEREPTGEQCDARPAVGYGHGEQAVERHLMEQGPCRRDGHDRAVEANQRYHRRPCGEAARDALGASQVECQQRRGQQPVDRVNPDAALLGEGAPRLRPTDVALVDVQNDIARDNKEQFNRARGERRENAQHVDTVLADEPEIQVKSHHRDYRDSPAVLETIEGGRAIFGHCATAIPQFEISAKAPPLVLTALSAIPSRAFPSARRNACTRWSYGRPDLQRDFETAHDGLTGSAGGLLSTLSPEPRSAHRPCRGKSCASTAIYT